MIKKAALTKAFLSFFEISLPEIGRNNCKTVFLSPPIIIIIASNVIVELVSHMFTSPDSFAGDDTRWGIVFALPE